MAVNTDVEHVSNISKMVEEMGLTIQNLLQEVYFGKAKDVVGDSRSMDIRRKKGGCFSLINILGIAPLIQTNKG